MECHHVVRLKKRIACRLTPRAFNSPGCHESGSQRSAQSAYFSVPHIAGSCNMAFVLFGDVQSSIWRMHERKLEVGAA
jgi:hypothetical protein